MPRVRLRYQLDCHGNTAWMKISRFVIDVMNKWFKTYVLSIRRDFLWHMIADRIPTHYGVGVEENARSICLNRIVCSHG